jgi:hypothetical protein
MNKLALVLAATSTVFTPEMAMAAQTKSRFTGYIYGVKSPQELADKVEKKLAQDPTGRTLIDPDQCRRSREAGCAAPINYLESFQKHDPQAGLTSVSELPAYMRRLILDCNVKGVYQMDRIVYSGGSLGKTDVSGMSRSFLKGECAWVNPETGRPALAQNCTNPVGQRIDIVCVLYNFESRAPAEFAVIWERIRRKDDPCFAFRKASRMYEPDSPKAVWQHVRPGCIGKPCDFGPYNRLYGYTAAAQGQIPLSGPGVYQFRLSPDEILAICMKSGDRQHPHTSFTAGGRWKQDYELHNGTMQVRVHYTMRESKAAGFDMNEPKGLFLYAADKAEEAQIRGAFSK